MYTASAEDLTPKIFILIALLVLILAMLSAIVCSINLEHYYKFNGDITVDAFYVTNLILLLDQFNIDPLMLYNSKVVNITFINLCKQCIVTLQISYKNEENILPITYNLTDNETITLKPPYNSYLFVLKSMNITNVRITIEGIYIHYPFKYLSIFSLFLFLVGTFILLYSCSVIIVSSSVRVKIMERTSVECNGSNAKFKDTT